MQVPILAVPLPEVCPWQRFTLSEPQHSHQYKGTSQGWETPTRACKRVTASCQSPGMGPVSVIHKRGTLGKALLLEPQWNKRVRLWSLPELQTTLLNTRRHCELAEPPQPHPPSQSSPPHGKGADILPRQGTFLSFLTQNCISFGSERSHFLMKP